MLFVLLGNKLISADTIAPLILKCKRDDPEKKLLVYTVSNETAQQIQINPILKEIIHSNCSVFVLQGYEGPKYKAIYGKVKTLFLLFFMKICVLCLNSKVIHFGALEDKPYSYFAFGRSINSIFMESNCWGYSDLIYRVDNSSVKRGGYRETELSNSGVMVHFSTEWPYYLNDKNCDLLKFKISSTRSWPIWHEFIENNANNYFAKEIERLGLDGSSPTIFFPLGYLGEINFLDYCGKSPEEVFAETLYLISKACPSATVVLKPHPITNTTALKNILDRAQNPNFKISYLHSSLLARLANVAVANYYTTVFSDCWSVNCPTIEFTKYAPEADRITSGLSMEPRYTTHKVELDQPDTFTELIMQCCDEEGVKRSSRMSTFTPDDQHFIDWLLA